jgi:YgiT-type zinc finger domain-containing protein
MTGEPENNRCYFCRGKLEHKLATMPFVVHDSVVIVKHVPAEVCSQCGETILSSTIARQTDALLKAVVSLNSEITVITYSAAHPQPV